jgi:hypothetical protein
LGKRIAFDAKSSRFWANGLLLVQNLQALGQMDCFWYKIFTQLGNMIKKVAP